MELTLVSCRDKNLFITLKQHKKKKTNKKRPKKEEGGERHKTYLICRDKLGEFDTWSCVLYHMLTFRRKPYYF